LEGRDGSLCCLSDSSHTAPYEEPKEHWNYNPNTQGFDRVTGRRSAGYVVAGQGGNQYNGLGDWRPIPLVNEIRTRVKAWRENNYPGITGVTRKLIGHWRAKDICRFPFFFCQIDAMETIIWLAEAPEAEKTGKIPHQPLRL
jgi:type III restriction enzyme